MVQLIQPYHLVSISPWPLLISLNLIFFFFRIILFFKGNGIKFIVWSFLILLIILFQWNRDLIRERTYLGDHTIKVIDGIKWGIKIFILSEVAFFFRVFYCFIYLSLSPDCHIGSNWPPKNIEIIDPFSIPLLNTIILLCSGVTLTLCHYSLILYKWRMRFKSLIFTVFLGIVFSYIQYLEYDDAIFTISDSRFGSIFFFSTGFHGFHVFLGTIMLLIILVRIKFGHFFDGNHVGLEFSIWYWHFVDVVWLLLYLRVYLFTRIR